MGTVLIAEGNDAVKKPFKPNPDDGLLWEFLHLVSQTHDFEFLIRSHPTTGEAMKKIWIYDRDRIGNLGGDKDQFVGYVSLQNREYQDGRLEPILEMHSNLTTKYRNDTVRTKKIGKAVASFSGMFRKQTPDEIGHMVESYVSSHQRGVTRDDRYDFVQLLSRLVSDSANKVACNLDEFAKMVDLDAGREERLQDKGKRWKSRMEFEEAYNRDSYTLTERKPEEWIVVRRYNKDSQPPRIMTSEQMPEWMRGKIGLLKLAADSAAYIEGVGQRYENGYYMVLGE
jgi:hypothetical protein